MYSSKVCEISAVCWPYTKYPNTASLFPIFKSIALTANMVSCNTLAESRGHKTWQNHPIYLKAVSTFAQH